MVNPAGGTDDERGQTGGAFTEAQKREMAAMIAEAFRNHGGGGGGQGPTPPPGGDPFNPGNAGYQGQGNVGHDWKPDDIGYFDPEYDGPANVGSPIVNAGRHVFYRDVYAFVDRLKDMAILRGEAKLRTVLPQCFRGSALIWHSMELSDLEKQLLRNADLESWYGAIIHRFKERTPAALQHLQRERYTMADARQQKNPRLFAQDIFRHAKAAEMTSLYNQLSIAWNNLDWEFRRDVPEPSTSTTMRAFLDQLDSKASIWYEMARRSGNSSSGNPSSQRQTSNMANSGKHDRRQTRDGFSQPAFGNSAPQYPSRSQGWTSYQYQNPAYQNRQSSNFEQARPAPAVAALPAARQPLRLTSGNASDSRNQTAQPNGGKPGDRYANNGRFPNKPRAYVANEDEENASAEGFDEVQDGYYANEDLDYWDPDNNDEGMQPEEASANIAMLELHHCRLCKQTFPSSNKLHRHLRVDCAGRKSALRKASETPWEKASAREPTMKPSANAYQSEVSTTGATKASTKDDIPIRDSSVDPSQDIGTGYGFRSWSYSKAKVALGKDSPPADVCLDTGAGITLGDRIFFKSQAPNTPVRTMATPLSVRGIGTHNHGSDEYAIADFYFDGVDEQGNPARAHFRREIHLVDDLKANVLIGNDILGSEGIVIDPLAKTASIKSCGVTIPVEVKSRLYGSAVKQPVNLRDSMVIPPNSQMLVPVHHGHLPERDFLFEPEPQSDISLFAHMVDASLHSVMVRNEGDRAVQLQRNLRLGTISELDYPNAFLVDPDENAMDLAVRKAKSIHKTSWFRKVMAAATGILAAVAPTLPETSADPTGVRPVPAYAAIIAEQPAAITASQLEKPSAERILPNGTTIYDSGGNAADILQRIVNSFPTLWEEKGFAKLPEENWMRIPLKSDWESRVSGKAKVYPLGSRDKALVDKTFDALHEEGKLSWTNESTPFSFPVFCVWKNDAGGNPKGRVVVDIRGLNAISQPDAYPLPLQSELITFVQGCQYITVIDCASFFYQWRVHPLDRHKLTVVSHRGQESFSVAVMGYRNSIAYVQRQIDRLLRVYRLFARAYVDDIVIASATLEEHVQHLTQVFQVLVDNNISIKPTKAFIGYPTVQLLGQKVNSFGLSTTEEKLRAIALIKFPITLGLLETYLGLTSWLRDYVPFYAGISKPLQERKTELLRKGPVAGRERKSFAAKTRLRDITELEKASFATLQKLLSRPSYLLHADKLRQLFVDLDASKEFGFGAMVYHVKDWDGKDYPKRRQVQPILFLSRLLTSAETRYWPTELELAGIVWVLKKIRHLVESAEPTLPTVIFTDHGAAIGISKQTSLTTSCTDKLNLRLVRASDYIQRFNLDLRHKPGKLHIIPDALSRLASNNTDPAKGFHEEGELDALFTCALIEVDEAFRKRITDGYLSDLNWQRIARTLDAPIADEDASKLPFVRENGLIFRADHYTTGAHAYQPRRLCIPFAVIKDIFDSVHGGENGHPGFAKCYERISASWYIRGLSRYLRDYLKHCPDCQIYQTRRHRPYGSLQPVLTPPVPFHTLAIDFILALPHTALGYNTVMSVTCKFTKRVTLIEGKITWSAQQWGSALLDRLDIADWGIPKAIISDRDRKFLSEMWKEIFGRLGIRFLYSAAYHPQTDGQSERTNQTVEIALRFHIAGMKNPADWLTALPRIQRGLNNSVSATTGHSPNEAAYGFTPLQAADLLKSSPVPKPQACRIAVADAIAFAQMTAKATYDRKHQAVFLKVGDYALLRLHHGYDIPSTKRVGRKLSQQYVGPFRVLERIGTLAYKLDIPSHWRIHPVFTIAQLEPCPSPDSDPYHRKRPDHPDSVFVEGDTAKVKSYEVEIILDKRETANRGYEYLVRWKGYGPEHDVWRSLPELGNAGDLVQDYEANLRGITHLPGRLQKASVTSLPSIGTPLLVARTDSHRKFAVVIPPKIIASPKPSDVTKRIILRKPSANGIPTTTSSFAAVVPPPRRSSRLGKSTSNS